MTETTWKRRDVLNQDSIFKIIQKYLSDVPIFLVGTGGTIPHGIPGIPELASYIIDKLDKKYKADSKWDQFVENLHSGMDLESALTGIDISQELLLDITKCTWKLISEKDLALFKRIVCYGEKLPLGRLIGHFFNAHPRCVHIITTNYRLRKNAIHKDSVYSKNIPTNENSRLNS